MAGAQLIAPPVRVIVLHRRNEPPGQCTLTPFRRAPRADLTIVDWPLSAPLELPGDALLLHVDGLPLAVTDAPATIVLIDTTWSKVGGVLRALPADLRRRSLPRGAQTAFPNVSKQGRDPAGGLATVEAIFLATSQLGARDERWLAHYAHRDRFLARNARP